MTPSVHYLLKIIPTEHGYKFHSNGSCSADSTIDWMGTEICVNECPRQKYLSKITFDTKEDFYIRKLIDNFKHFENISIFEIILNKKIII